MLFISDQIRYNTAVQAATVARDTLAQARRELCRRYPDRANFAMRVRLLEPHLNIRLNQLYPNCVFAANKVEAMWDSQWISSRSMDELIFMWAQFDHKMEWIADMRLTGRNQLWYNMAIDAITNDYLIQAGVGSMPENGLLMDGIHGNMDPEEAYDVVRHMWERSVTVVDELGKSHLDVDNLQEIIHTQNEGTPVGRLTGGMFEEAISTQWSNHA